MKFFIHLTIILILIIFMAIASSADTWYVRKDSSGDTDDIQNAIDLAQNGDTIIVGPGLYAIVVDVEHGYFISKPIHIISESGPTKTTIRNYSGGVVSGNWWFTYGFYVDNPGGPFTIKGFKIKDTSVETYHGIWGGWAIRVCNGEGVISDNIFTNNDRSALDIAEGSSVIIENNIFYSDFHNGILVYDSEAIIRFNTITGNHAAVLISTNAYATIHNNILANNKIYGFYCTSPIENITFECNNVWNNTSANYYGNIPDQTGMNGNISVDPLFCGIAGSNNYYLQSNSPCASSNVPEFCNNNRMGCYPVHCTVGTENDSWGKIKKLFDK